MSSFYRCVQNSFFGRLVYVHTNYKCFKHPEDEPGYVISKEYDNTGEVITLEWEEGDIEHPQNWPKIMKGMVMVQITLLSFLVYLGGPIYAPAIPTIMEKFNISYPVASLPLAFYILGYGIGQMFCSPLSEQAAIGRTPVYFFLHIIAVILQIPTALCNNIAGLIILRFLTGLFVSPVFCVGPGSYGDVCSPSKLHIGLCLWILSGFCGPSTGPIIGSALLLKSWRNIFWFVFAVLGFITIFMFFASPETNQHTLLHWKAQRLRRVTGNPNILTKQEQENANIFVTLAEVSWKAFEIIIEEPIVLLIDIYTGLVYGCVYLWFEAFPIAFGFLGFSEMATSAAYNTINVGTAIGAFLYIVGLNRVFAVRARNNEPVTPNVFLVASFIGITCSTISFFWFGWTVNPRIHWIVPIIGAAFFGITAMGSLQGNLNYLGMSFPNHIASVFGGNGLFRSAVGGSFPIYGRALFNNLAIKDYPVAWGCSLIGFISLLMMLIPLLLMKYGESLRSRSKFSQ